MQDPMYTLKKGDIILADTGKAGGEVIAREEVLARLEDLVFTRRIQIGDTYGPPTGPQLIEDLITYGFKKEEK